MTSGVPGHGIRIRVLAWPGLGARADNPYTWLLYSHLASLGVEVEEFTVARAFRGGYHVLHVHWPEKALTSRSWLGRAAGATAVLAVLEAAHLHGARVVWTAHNATPHEARHPELEHRFWSAFTRRIDAVIHPSAAGQLELEARYPNLARLPHAVVPLGDFRGTYPDNLSRSDARTSLAIPDSARVITFIGQVRRYKNVPHLVRTVRALPPTAGPVILLVAGAPQSPALAHEVRAAAAGDPRVRLRLEHVPDGDVQLYLRAADLVVLPFKEITNSASALLALSFDRPILVPALGAMAELKAQIGPDWVHTYEGQLTPELLAAALEWAIQRPAGGSPPLEAFRWPAIASRTVSTYLAAAPASAGKS